MSSKNYDNEYTITTKVEVPKVTNMKCILCNKEYTNKDVGVLNCIVHPRNYNTFVNGKRFSMGHYECCGASKNLDDTIHYEITNPKGCHKINHVSSEEELDNIITKPFVCIPADISSDLKIIQNAQKPIQKNQYIIPVLEEEELDYNYAFKTPLENVFDIDIHQEYKEMLENYKLIPDKTFKNKDNTNDRYYVYENDEEYGQMRKRLKSNHLIIRNEEDFVPFYVIRTMDYTFDKERLKEFNPNRKCKFQKMS